LSIASVGVGEDGEDFDRFPIVVSNTHAHSANL
jgi:hypothetical protein